MAISSKAAAIRPGQLPVRRQRIERWASKGRNVSMDDKPIRISTCIGTSLTQKQSESSCFQADRRLNTHLIQLGEEREKLIERHNFDQKLFAHKQALHHKDNQTILSTLDYVRKCCKYPHIYDNDEELINPTIFLEENGIRKTSRSRPLTTTASTAKSNLSPNTHTRSSNSVKEIFLKHNKKHIQSSRKSNERHVQFQPNNKRDLQSAHVSNRNRSISSADILQSMNSTTFITECDRSEERIKSPSPKPKRPLSRIISSKKSLHEFRRYPERFLSQSNRYLPLLHHQAMKIKSQEFSRKHSIQSSLFESSEFVCDDATSFLSEDIEAGKSTHMPVWDCHDRKNQKKLPVSSKTDEASERKMALSRLRDREYAHLHTLIRSNSIEHILKPFSSIKTVDNKHRPSICLNDILHSIDSLRCSRKVHKEIDIEKNLSKLGILIF